MKIVDKIIKLKSDIMPPKNSFIEDKIRLLGIEPIRWAIIEIQNDELTLNVTGYEIKE